MDLVTRILLIIFTIAVALVVGLLLRRRLVARLKKTVLDTWIIQTLGILILIPSLIVAAVIVPIIYGWSTEALSILLRDIQNTFPTQTRDLPDLLWNLVKTALLIALGVGVARTARAITIRGLEESRIDINMRTLIGRLFYFLILTFSTFWILSIWDISLGIPVAFLGIVTVALTVAIQDVLKDLTAGFYILIERPFYIGNTISITSSAATYTGKVENVQLRATKLRLVSGEEVTIPNSLVFGGVVVNNSYYGERRATINITLPQEHFRAGETQEQILRVIKENESVVPKPEANILFTSYTDKKVTLTLRFWIATEMHTAISEIMHTLHTALPDAELNIKEFAGNV